MPDPIYKDMWYLVSIVTRSFFWLVVYSIRLLQHKGAQGGFDMNVENAWRL